MGTLFLAGLVLSAPAIAQQAGHTEPSAVNTLSIEEIVRQQQAVLAEQERRLAEQEKALAEQRNALRAQQQRIDALVAYIQQTMAQAQQQTAQPPQEHAQPVQENVQTAQQSVKAAPPDQSPELSSAPEPDVVGERPPEKKPEVTVLADRGGVLISAAAGFPSSLRLNISVPMWTGRKSPALPSCPAF
ncbi:hypothetical protein [Emcibacter sp.]|uniref:hypothetical protein n=1 Tax=Emcibacter sp. TaxID=1979954 RepID=UPI002AA77A3C|nr:hypothetical protein [Emcibacter sp.]